MTNQIVSLYVYKRLNADIEEYGTYKSMEELVEDVAFSLAEYEVFSIPKPDITDRQISHAVITDDETAKFIDAFPDLETTIERRKNELVQQFNEEK